MTKTLTFTQDNLSALKADPEIWAAVNAACGEVGEPLGKLEVSEDGVRLDSFYAGCDRAIAPHTKGQMSLHRKQRFIDFTSPDPGMVKLYNLRARILALGGAA